MSYPMTRGLGYTNDNGTKSISESSLGDLAEEILRARAKFPGNRLIFTALSEEVGELARAFLQRQGERRVREEALQVACLAMRIYEEGDPIYDTLTDAESLP